MLLPSSPCQQLSQSAAALPHTLIIKRERGSATSLNLLLFLSSYPLLPLLFFLTSPPPFSLINFVLLREEERDEERNLLLPSYVSLHSPFPSLPALSFSRLLPCPISRFFTNHFTFFLVFSPPLFRSHTSTSTSSSSLLPPSSVSQRLFCDSDIPPGCGGVSLGTAAAEFQKI